MTNVRLQKATICDLEKLQQISRKAYYENYFNHWNTQKGIDDYLENQFGESKLIEELKNTDILYSFIFHKAEIIGFTKLNLSPKEVFSSRYCCELEKIYLRPKYIGRGIGRIAMNDILSIAVGKAQEEIILYVIDSNEKAIRFYQGFGFKIDKKTKFLIPDFKDELRGLFRMKCGLGSYS